MIRLVGAPAYPCISMSEHPFHYSMVVDGHPLHPYQAENLLFTLERYGLAPRDRIVVQCTDRVPEQVRNELARNRYTVTVISPYLDGRYCNKVVQLDHFVREGLSRACGVVLLDLDFVVLSPLEPVVTDRVWGKIVDADNPPLHVLERIFAQAGVDVPGIVPSDWGTGDTVATNFNGGFLYVPGGFVPRMQAAWRRWAEFLHARPDLFEEPGHRDHTDQISFALALAAEGIPCRHLPANWNFPLHSPGVPRSFEPGADVSGLHYHWCLDAFGLVDPVFRDGSVVDETVRRVNAALGARDASPFFDRYKRHLAREAVGLVPVAGKPSFSGDFIARTRNGDRKRRLILHAGTPKTGTTALQWHLASNREHLAELGFWYPAPSTYTHEPKHQQLVDRLRSGDATAFREYVEEALRDMPEATHTVLFTTEGIFNHWWDFTPRARGLLRDLAALFDFELCVWFREPEAFAAALYVQYTRNGRCEDVMRNVYGQDIDCVEALRDPWFVRHLDYAGFCHEARHLFGADRVRAFVYSGDTVRDFKARYGIGALPQAPRQRNATPGSLAVHLLRALNRAALEPERRARGVDLIEAMDRVVGGWTGRFRLTERERRLVDQLARRGWEVIRRNEIVTVSGGGA